MTVFDDELKSMIEGEFSESITLETPFVNIDTVGFFDETYEQIDPETGALVMSNNPRASIYSKDALTVVDKIEEGWILIARGKRYRIKTVNNDGAGIITMELKNA